MTEQAGPLPLLILASIFLAVWNMDPFFIEEGDATTRREEPVNAKYSTMQSDQKTREKSDSSYVLPPSTAIKTGNTNQFQRKEQPVSSF
ncbi:MAG TPA: hypothetical protein DCR17_06265 [Verrucomicrobiales bacterium]|nr:hypothetical protein [Pedosphaera sp.]RZO73746.1 MAG: hypothetical protein EVA71_01610 [Limisphaerales bacterium]HAO66271.1 hypothetical protein [Verrucomicrobiales bacterium]HAR00059.1 hypothetical protein [Verrucomicrobiales bacterium]HBP55796.1 hypothetical protein [Verrucomicrobiales bacterium]